MLWMGRDLKGHPGISVGTSRYPRLLQVPSELGHSKDLAATASLCQWEVVFGNPGIFLGKNSRVCSVLLGMLEFHWLCFPASLWRLWPHPLEAAGGWENLSMWEPWDPFPWDFWFAGSSRWIPGIRGPPGSADGSLGSLIH